MIERIGHDTKISACATCTASSGTNEKAVTFTYLFQIVFQSKDNVPPVRDDAVHAHVNHFQPIMARILVFLNTNRIPVPFAWYILPCLLIVR